MTGYSKYERIMCSYKIQEMTAHQNHARKRSSATPASVHSNNYEQPVEHPPSFTNIQRDANNASDDDMLTGWW